MDLFTQEFLTKPVWMWAAFLTIVVVLLALDLGVLHRKSRDIGVRESLALSAGYLTLGLAFGGWVWSSLGPQAGIEYLTGFVVEKSLAMDNVFVIAMIFAYFAIPAHLQHRVLFWGILGVIVLRAAGLGRGDAALLAILAGSASYIAVPAAMRLAAPQADAGVFVSSSLAVTFPFNLVVGIPVYVALSGQIRG